MDRRTKQILTIIICLLIFGMGIVYDISTMSSDKISIIKLLF